MRSKFGFVAAVIVLSISTPGLLAKPTRKEIEKKKAEIMARAKREHEQRKRTGIVWKYIAAGDKARKADKNQLAERYYYQALKNTDKKKYESSSIREVEKGMIISKLVTVASN